MTPTDPSALARPVISTEEVAALLRDRWHLPAPVRELGSQQDRNFLVSAPEGTVVFKLAGPATTRDQLTAQHRAMAVLDRVGISVPRLRRTPAGEDLVTVDLPGRPTCLARTLTFLDGEPLIDVVPYGAAQAAAIGDVAGRITAALADFSHPGTGAWSQWDVRRAVEVIDALLEWTPEPQRDRVTAVVRDAVAQLSPLGDLLPLQTIHADVTDDNVVLRADGTVGVIDFGDLMHSWRVGEVVASGACAFMRDDADALFLATIRGYTEHVTLTDAELSAVWPLTVLRTAVLVVSGFHQTAVDDDNVYAQDRMAAEWRSFEAVAGRDAARMEALVRAAAGSARDRRSVLLPPGCAPAVVDLSVTTDELADGAWLEHDAAETVLRRRAAIAGAAVTRWGEYRLTRTVPFAPRGTAATLAVGVEFVSTADLVLTAPFAGSLRGDADGIVLSGEEGRLTILGAAVHPSAPPGTVTAGHVIGILRADAIGTIRFSPPGGELGPFFVTPSAAEAACASSLDPSPLLGVDVSASRPRPDTLLERRNAAYAAAQEHYFAHPPQIERGWREFLIDTHAQTYVDVVNNVSIAGHAHPGIVRAVARQWGLLNTNSRFHYEAVAELSERLAELAPEGLDRVFLVNSGSEAVDLSLRLAMTATGRGRILAAREAYHGWTLGSDAVSTSLGDNPRALSTRPAWVELLDAPNPVRGTHRGGDSAPAYLADVDAQLSALGEDGRRSIAGVILEPIFGNGGGVLLPEGYLAGVYERVRALGGVCIADEVQVGYGRLGDHFWGFQQQGAVPDVIAVAKAMGNGQPLGAVITTRKIAEAFEAEGSFFSSAGGSPVSCRVGIAVLDAIEQDDLQGNARRVGAVLSEGLRGLAAQHPSIGAVHGMGLYLGVELVEPGTLRPATRLADAVCDALLGEGCIVQPTGDHKNVLKIKPPLCITAESARFVTAALDRALAAQGR